MRQWWSPYELWTQSGLLRNCVGCLHISEAIYLCQVHPHGKMEQSKEWELNSKALYFMSLPAWNPLATLLCLLHKIQVPYLGLWQFPEPDYVQILNLPLTGHVTLGKVFDHSARFPLLINEKNSIGLLCTRLMYNIKRSLALTSHISSLSSPIISRLGLNAPHRTRDLTSQVATSNPGVWKS